MMSSTDPMRPEGELRVELSRRSKVDTAWTIEHERYLRVHWKAGDSAGQMGKALGRTRASVCSKLDRMGLLKTRKTKPQKPLPAIRKRSKQYHGDFVMSSTPQPGDKRPLRGAAWKPLPGIEPVTLLALEPGMCKWPVTDDKPFLFCGATTPEGKSYCDHHQHLSTGHGTPSERDALRELRRAA